MLTVFGEKDRPRPCPLPHGAFSQAPAFLLFPSWPLLFPPCQRQNFFKKGRRRGRGQKVFIFDRFSLGTISCIWGQTCFGCLKMTLSNNFTDSSIFLGVFDCPSSDKGNVFLASCRPSPFSRQQSREGFKMMTPDWFSLPHGSHLLQRKLSTAPNNLWECLLAPDLRAAGQPVLPFTISRQDSTSNSVSLTARDAFLH